MDKVVGAVGLSVAKRHGLIEAIRRVMSSYLPIGYPWQNATASLKLRAARQPCRAIYRLSVAKRHGLIEAAKQIQKRSAGSALSVAKRHGLIEAMR